MSSDNLYKEKIIDHYKNPRNFGEIADSDYSAHLTNSVCGDEVTYYLCVKDGVVEKAGFKGSGCAISIAASSMLSEKLVGMKLEDIKELNNEFVLNLLGIKGRSPRLKCAILGLQAAKRAIEDGDDDPCDFC